MTTVPDSPPSPEAPVAPHDHAGARRASPSLALAALGVVYGDIGTSPLYALKECFAPEYGVRPDAANVLGVLSLIFWSLNFVVSFKYLDLHHAGRQPGRGRDHGAARAAASAAAAAWARAACWWGSGSSARRCCTATGSSRRRSRCWAPSRASAWPRRRLPGVGGAPSLSSLILVALFMFQRRGTARVGAVFGRVMVVWFTAIARAGRPRHPAAPRGAGRASIPGTRSASSSATGCAAS